MPLPAPPTPTAPPPTKRFFCSDPARCSCSRYTPTHTLTSISLQNVRSLTHPHKHTLTASTKITHGTHKRTPINTLALTLALTPPSLSYLWFCDFVVLLSAFQFEAKAFQGPWDEEPVWKLYKVRTRREVFVVVAAAGDCVGICEMSPRNAKLGTRIGRLTGFLSPRRVAMCAHELPCVIPSYMNLVNVPSPLPPPRSGPAPNPRADPCRPPSTPRPFPQGSFSRKLLDSKIITLEGAIYDVTGKMLWKRKVKSGKFNARRRPSTKPRAAGGGGGGASRGGVNKGKGDGRSTRRSGEGATGAAAESSRKGQRGAGGGGASDPRESGQRRRRQQ